LSNYSLSRSLGNSQRTDQTGVSCELTSAFGGVLDVVELDKVAVHRGSVPDNEHLAWWCQWQTNVLRLTWSVCWRQPMLDITEWKTGMFLSLSVSYYMYDT